MTIISKLNLVHNCAEKIGLPALSQCHLYVLIVSSGRLFNKKHRHYQRLWRRWRTRAKIKISLLPCHFIRVTVKQFISLLLTLSFLFYFWVISTCLKAFRTSRGLNQARVGPVVVRSTADREVRAHGQNTTLA